MSVQKIDTKVLPVANGIQSARWLGRALLRHPLRALLTLIVSMGAAAASIQTLSLFGTLIDAVREGNGQQALASTGVLLVLMALLAGACGGLSLYLATSLGEKILATLREEVLCRALQSPAHRVEEAGRGDLLSRVSDDVAVMNRVVEEMLPRLIAAFLLVVMGFVALAGMDVRLAAAGLLAVPLQVLGVWWYLRASSPVFTAERQAVARRSQSLMESLSGASTVRAYRVQEVRRDLINRSSGAVLGLNLRTITLFSRLVGFANGAEFVGLGALLSVGFFLVSSGDVSVGQASAAALIFHRLFDPVGTVLYSFRDIQQAGASVGRLVGVLGMKISQRPERVGEGTDYNLLAPVSQGGASVELREVSFEYEPDRPILKNINLSLTAGEKIALVGSTGAGKSTLAAVISGLLEPTSGRVSIHPDSPSQLTEDLTVVSVSQEVHVFSGSLADDVRLARPHMRDEDVQTVLEKVGAWDWVCRLPKGMHTMVGEDGHRLTAAQAQHVALARAELADPQLIVLDEATAEAGSAGAKVLDAAASVVTEGRTSVVVAHRLSQAIEAQRILVMEGGQIVEEGSAQDLINAGGSFAQLWEAWGARMGELGRHPVN